MSDISDELPAAEELTTSGQPPWVTPAENPLAKDPLAAAAPLSIPIADPPVPFQRLDPASVTVERISGWIFTLLLLLAGAIAVAATGFNLGLFDVALWVVVSVYAVLGSGLIWVTHFLPKRQYACAKWRLTHSGLEIHSGLWWRSQISVPLARVQHTDVHQGPLLRKFGLARLIVHTAGTENASVQLAGLSFATAQRLRDALIESRVEIDGV